MPCLKEEYNNIIRICVVGFIKNKKNGEKIRKTKKRSLNMKSILKVFKSCLFKLFLLDLILLLLFKYHQPECEPCLDDINCPPCLSEEQYFIIYFGIAVNIVICIICVFKSFSDHKTR